MMTKNADKKREQMMMFSMDDMVPQNHMLRLIDKDTIHSVSLWNKKHAADHERDRGKRCIPLVSWTGHARSDTSFFYIWKELYPPFQRHRPF